MIAPYTYDVLCAEAKRITDAYPRLRLSSIGKSLCGRELVRLSLGEGSRRVFYNGAHHGMEWLTCALLMRFAEEAAAALNSGGKIGGIPARELFADAALELVPMVNPDGVELAARGLSADNPNYSKLRDLNPDGNFSHWQANNRGVDLNHNYNAGWANSKSAESAYGIFGPGPTRFGGSAPESEPESRATANFTRNGNFSLTIAFHSQGRVIYHGFDGKEPPFSREIAEHFVRVSPYSLDETEGIASYGGYKDWFVHAFGRPGFTVEIGLGENPLPPEQLDEIYADTLGILTGGICLAPSVE